MISADGERKKLFLRAPELVSEEIHLESKKH